MDHLEAIVIMALAAQGAFVAMGEGMVFEKIGMVKLLGKVNEPWRHPLSTCARCMVSTWGTLAVLILGCHPEYLITTEAWHYEPYFAWLEVDVTPNWSAIGQLPVLWLCAAGLQELLNP